VAKILVADDNSNIQKMVGLALKDHGIDVIAVGNGEAAVRKIADLRPDLVLADVFMPVRNGYEVCKFVKGDSSLAHIPVILLVGAFDPLDEQEAQRVGADGVLKKPFVPPDPLISMVKSALQRASAGHTAASSSAVKTTVPTSTAAKGGSANATVVHSAAPTTAVAVPEPEQTQSFVETIPARPEELKIDASNQPLAFGTLLNTAAAPEVEEEAAYIAPVNPELADRDFGAAETDEVEEEEEEESGSSAWRRDGGNEVFADEVEATAEKTASRAKRRESWSPTREKTQDLLESAAEPDFTSAPPVEIKASGPASVTLQDSWAKPPLTQEPETKPAPMETAPVAPVAVTPAPIPAATPLELPPMPVVSSPEVAATEAPVLETAPPSNANAWFSTTASPWEAEAQKASQLASSWDAPAAPIETAPAKSEEIQAEPEPLQVADSAPSYDFVSEAPSDEPVHYLPDPALVGNEQVTNGTLPELISDGVLPGDVVKTIQQETSYAVESVVQQAQEEPVGSFTKEAPAGPDMDELVAKVLAKMSPEMLQAVTREILKPVVEAMVRDEISSKKS
jgi:CheY-like chemotaxis protein